MSKFAQYLQPNRYRKWWVEVGLLSLAALTFWAGRYAYLAYSTAENLMPQLSIESAKLNSLVPVKPSRAQLEAKQQWKQVLLERDFDWDSIFNALQNVNNSDIELLEFRPEKRQGIIILRGEARSITALSTYLEELGKQPAFTQIYLTKQDLRAHGQLETVGFELRGSIRR